MKRISLSLILLLLLVSGGCVSVKLDGFREIAEAHPKGMEMAVESEEGAAFVRALGLYINKLEYELEKQ